MIAATVFLVLLITVIGKMVYDVQMNKKNGKYLTNYYAMERDETDVIYDESTMDSD